MITPKSQVLMVLIGLGLLLVPVCSQAATFRGGQNVTVTEATDDLYVAGGNVMLTKPVEGDLYVGGSTVTIDPEAAVSGDLNAGGGQMWLNGSVGDDARLAGATVYVNGEIGDDLFLAAGNVFIAGTVHGDVYAAGGTVNVSGTVDGNVRASGGQIVLDQGAEIKGNLEYSSQDLATVNDGAKVDGATVFHRVETQGRAWQPHGLSWFAGLAGLSGLAIPVLFVLALVAVFLLSLVVVFAAPLKTRDVLQTMKGHPWKSLGLGLVYLIVTPIVGFILLVIPFAFPVAILVWFIYLASLVLLPALCAFWLGANLLKLFKKDADLNRRSHLVLSILLGTVIYSLIMMVPLIGGIIILIGFIFAAGALFQVVRPLVFKKREWSKGNLPGGQ